MNSPRLDIAQRILITSVVILALGEMYILMRPSSVPQTAGNLSEAQGAGNVASTTSARAPAPDDVLLGISGTIAGVSTNSIDLSSASAAGAPSGSSVQHILITSSTQIMKQGALKSQAQQAADMQAFHAYSDQLMQDPVKNKVALQHLVAPSPYTETAIPLSALSVGAQVFVFYDQGASGMTAHQITVLPAADTARTQ